MKFLLTIAYGLLFLGSSALAADEQQDWVQVAREIRSQGEAILSTYRPDQGWDTADRFSDLYFDEFEASGLERAIGLRDPQEKAALESQFSTLIGLATRQQPRETLEEAWATLRHRLSEAAQSLQVQQQMGFWSLFLQSFLILLREGFEAMLVITALVAYLQRRGRFDQITVIYQGVGWALGASLLTAIALRHLFVISGPAREALEGLTMLIAAAVLFYVSYWLISKREADRWQAYIRGQMDRALSRGSLFALGFAAFLAVYREGAETVLFYQALAGQASATHPALWSGMGLAALALMGLYWFMRQASARLPIGLFFGLTAGLLYYLAIRFAGNGVLELQEAGWLRITPLEAVPQIPWLGLYPSWESLGVQLLLLLPLPFALGWWWLQRRQLAGAQS